MFLIERQDLASTPEEDGNQLIKAHKVLIKVPIQKGLEELKAKDIVDIAGTRFTIDSILARPGYRPHYYELHCVEI